MSIKRCFSILIVTVVFILSSAHAYAGMTGGGIGSAMLAMLAYIFFLIGFLILWLMLHLMYKAGSIKALLIKSFVDLAVILYGSFPLSMVMDYKYKWSGLGVTHGALFIPGFIVLAVLAAGILFLLNKYILYFPKTGIIFHFFLCLSVAVGMLAMFEPKIVGPVAKCFVDYEKMKKNGDVEGALYFGYKIENDVSSFGKGNVARAYSDKAFEYYLKGQDNEAIIYYSKAIEADRTFIPACINLTWILSTSPDGKNRNGKLALDVIEKAVTYNNCKIITLSDARVLVCGELFSANAAAYAEVGNFDEAIRLQGKGLFMLRSGGYASASDKREIFLKSYIYRKPWRQNIKERISNFGNSVF